MRRILFTFIMLAVSFSLVPCLAANKTDAKSIYRNTRFNYQIPYAQHWKMLKQDKNAKVSVFLCQSSVCHADSQFIVSARTDSNLANLDNQYFMKHLNEHSVRKLLYNMIDRIGKINKLYFIRSGKVGNLHGYHAKALVRFQLGGVTKILYYALTFNKGNFYNLQFFSVEDQFDKDFLLGRALFDDFTVNSNGAVKK